MGDRGEPWDACVSRPTRNHRAPGPGHSDRPRKAEGARVLPLTLSLCLVTRLRRELSLHFALMVPLSVLSILLAPSSLLRGGKMDEGGQQGQRPF